MIQIALHTASSVWQSRICSITVPTGNIGENFRFGIIPFPSRSAKLPFFRDVLMNDAPLSSLHSKSSHYSIHNYTNKNELQLQLCRSHCISQFECVKYTSEMKANGKAESNWNVISSSELEFWELPRHFT